MPKSLKLTKQAMLRVKKMVQMDFAEVDSLGCSFDFIGPVASAAKTFTEPPTSEGNTAMVKNTIPRPPIHWVKERQKSMPWGKHSTSSSMVAPVVVNPEMVSK